MREKAHDKKRTNSSKRWLERHVNDRFVKESIRQGFRSRAAYKLIELEEKYGFLKKARGVVDLGAAPGGWTQIILKKAPQADFVLGMDLLEISPMSGAQFIQGDFLSEEGYEQLVEAIGDRYLDVVLSDLSPNTTGIQSVDHIRIMALVEGVYDLALKVLTKGGSFAAKVFKGGTEQNLLKDMKSRFTKVTHFKPQSSRKESPEIYVVAQGFKG